MPEPATTLVPALLEPGVIVAAVELQELRPKPSTPAVEAGTLRLAIVELLQGPARYTRGAVVHVPYAFSRDLDVRPVDRDGWGEVELEPGARYVLVARPTSDAMAWTAAAIVLADAEPAAEPAPGPGPRRTARLGSPTVVATRQALELAATKDLAERLARLKDAVRAPSRIVAEAANHLLLAPGAYGRAAVVAALAPLVGDAALPLRTRLAAGFRVSGAPCWDPAAGADPPNAQSIAALARALVGADVETGSTWLRLLAPCVGHPFASDAARSAAVRRALVAQVTDPAPARVLAALEPRTAPRDDGEDRLASALVAAWRDAHPT